MILTNFNTDQNYQTMPRPRIDIEKDATDWIIEIVGFLFLAGLILTPLYFYDTLPDQIATHYNGAGKADGFSDKNSIWMLPALGLAMFTGLRIDEIPSYL